MRLTADENLPPELVAWLRRIGCDVVWIKEGTRGAADGDILQAATEAGRIVVTHDNDFGDLVFRQGRAAAEVTLLRLSSTGPQDLVTQVALRWDAITSVARGNFVTLDDQTIRVRALPPRAS